MQPLAGLPCWAAGLRAPCLLLPHSGRQRDSLWVICEGGEEGSEGHMAVTRPQGGCGEELGPGCDLPPLPGSS